MNGRDLDLNHRIAMNTVHQTTRFGLVRHAQTRWNVDKRIQGQQDSPLTANGIRQARQWGDDLSAFSWDVCICSDLGRARETAGHINASLNLSLATDARLREQDWGDWTGSTIAGLTKNHPEELAKQVTRGWAFCPPGGEDRLAVLKRGQAALEDMAARYMGASILVVSHEGLIKCLLYRCLNRKFIPTEKPVLRAYHLHWITCDRNGLAIEKLNALALQI